MLHLKKKKCNDILIPKWENPTKEGEVRSLLPLVLLDFHVRLLSFRRHFYTSEASGLMILSEVNVELICGGCVYMLNS